MKLKFLTCDLARPVLKRLPAARVRLLGYLGGGRQDDPDWRHYRRRHRVFFDPELRANVYCDLAEWGGRWHYYAGRYYDPANRLLIRALLRPGDTYVDIGANLGMHTLAAARQVGPGGRVLSFEPNPDTFAVLSTHLRINGLQNVRAYNVGLGDEDGQLQLSGADHSGTHTLRPVDPQDAGQVGIGELRRVGVGVRRFDELVSPEQLVGRTLVKIDVEGYEEKALRAMGRTLARPDTSFVVEITDAWLRQLGGGGAGGVFGMFWDAGYGAHVVRVDKGLRDRLRFEAVADSGAIPDEGQYNVFFSRQPPPSA